ncbi:hypothetical protein ACFX2A_036151 [Malus domestica]
MGEVFGFLDGEGISNALLLSYYALLFTDASAWRWSWRKTTGKMNLAIMPSYSTDASVGTGKMNLPSQLGVGGRQQDGDRSARSVASADTRAREGGE